MTLRQKYERANRRHYDLEAVVAFTMFGIGLGFGGVMAWALICAFVAAFC